jgi:tetratricopeptide (TPR) repeat protein
MPRLFSYFWIFTCLFPVSLEGIPYFEFSPQAKATYDAIFSLKFRKADQLLYQLKTAEPDNQIYHLLENYKDCLTIFIGENESTFDKLKKNKQYRLKEIRKGDMQSPYYLFVQADIHLQWAIARAKFEEYFQAAIEIKRAYHLLIKNQELFPDFMPNKKNLGIMHALIGTVPNQYQWGIKLLGMNGTINQGKQEIQEVLKYARKRDFIFHQETQVIYAYLLLNLENNDKEAWEIIQSTHIDHRNNPLACFVKANIAMKTGRNDLAIQYLKESPSGPDYFPFPYLDFMLGTAKLNRMDQDADQFLKAFITHTRGKHYIKEAYQKLGWFEIVNDRTEHFNKYQEACKRFGAAVIEEDKTALRSARSGSIPNPSLLSARLFFDGGYYEKALALLLKFTPDAFIESTYQLEYHYRLGRVYHALGQHNEAITEYESTVKAGKFESTYYACNAALMMGKIFEKENNLEKAKQWYQTTLDIKPDEYRSSLHQQAKAGLIRLAEIE